ncbi:hypothetical protein Goklo_001728 [Gossypium klotzschianum]|uniref:Methylthioribose-1-phosphate isomerase n=1 Tax=Gossypium klotzschianum TaxID=34286 RepID=A0A7J8W1B2_9ROSI|nr:hypothetical protein [Gossypium klotzschianum]
MALDSKLIDDGLAADNTLQAICYKRGSLQLLDQRKLPLETMYLDIHGSTDGWNAIRDMVVRGAPAIAIAAALSLAVEVANLKDFNGGSKDAASFLESKLEYLVSRSQSTPQRIGVVPRSCRASIESLKVRRGEHLEALSRVWVHNHLPWEREYVRSWWGLNRCPLYSIKEQVWHHFRPTAVNLSDAAIKLKEIISKAASTVTVPESVFQAYIEAAEIMLDDDVATNKAIGSHGANFLQHQQNNSKRFSVLTHCNTGSLATAGYGTALGVIRALHAQGVLERAYCTETRPFNQGSRLTAFELVHEKIPATLIADSAAAALMKEGRVDAVIVGADRVTANGDTANKIGTYSLALCAVHHHIPFYVAAPLTSIDLSLSSGQEIVIEERSAKELLHTRGGLGEQVGASGISVWNPAFDVTPANLIAGIITEKGVITKNDMKDDAFDIKDFIEKATGKSTV